MPTKVRSKLAYKKDFIKNNCKDLRFLALNINEGNNTISPFFSECEIFS